MNWKQYKRKGLSEMRPYIQGEVLPPCVSISEADLKNGSPKVGDMIARNPKNHDDQWLVAEKYFNDNLELAPAPEEPANPTCSNTTHKHSYCDCENPTPIQPEWRIKSLKEYIENGDEYERNYFWLPVPSRWVGQLVEVRKPKVRTRRPLPVQEEMPMGEAPDDLHAWMRIQEDINKEVAGELRYLRDEIQKLKEATPHANR
jgi:hypothetical protein